MNIRKTKCWYVKCRKGHVKGSAMTMVDAMMLADEMVLQGHKEVQIYRGQPQLEFK